MVFTAWGVLPLLLIIVIVCVHKPLKLPLRPEAQTSSSDEHSGSNAPPVAPGLVLAYLNMQSNPP